jgi:hypothetical protein
MVHAIAQVINVESVKARKEVIKIIGDGVDANNNPSDILIKVLEWCGNE